MRTPACVAACLVSLLSLGALAQATKFEGTWEAATKGKVFLVLTCAVAWRSWQQQASRRIFAPYSPRLPKCYKSEMRQRRTGEDQAIALLLACCYQE